MAFVVEDGRARLRLLRLGRILPDWIEILAGLAEGEVVVSEPVPGLREGDPVEPQASQAQNPSAGKGS
jgi:hypothetical protein